MENKVFEHVMLDLETMGNKGNSAIVSIGAVEFNIETGETGREFYRMVNLQSCLDIGLKINASTLYWWLKQNETAREEICKGENESDIQLVLAELQDWFSECIEQVKVWGNGARFDIGILEDAYVACRYQKMPWHFRDERDLRTLVAFAPGIKNGVMANFKGVIHNPIDDCKMQIQYASEIWNKLKI